MLGWVYEAAKASPLLEDVIIATDSPEILEVCEQNGWNALITSASHRSGTDRVHEIANTIPADVYVNIQGDEPLTVPEHISALLAVMSLPEVEVGTLKVACTPEDITNPNVVKVVTATDGRALYFSRATIPYDRDQTGYKGYFKHLGFYAYTKAALDRFCTLPESELEHTERLEQLRFLDNGIEIYVAETPFDTVGVDTEEDLARVEKILSRPRNPR